MIRVDILFKILLYSKFENSNNSHNALQARIFGAADHFESRSGGNLGYLSVSVSLIVHYQRCFASPLSQFLCRYRFVMLH